MAHETPKDPPKGTRRFYFTLTPLALFVLPARAASYWPVPVSQIPKCGVRSKNNNFLGRSATRPTYAIRLEEITYYNHKTRD